MTRNGTARWLVATMVAAGALASARASHAQNFTGTVFAQGSAVGGSQPDSIAVGGGHVFVEYSNGASSSAPLGTGGASTIAEYDYSGRVLNTYSVLGVADGLRYNPSTNQLWALQNQDGNSALTVIEPTTGAKAQFNYTSSTPGRGYDDVAFVGGNAYISYANPGNSSDPASPIIYQATLGNGTISLTSVLLANATGINSATGQAGQPIPATDPDSLDVRPDGSLLLTGEGDGALTTIRNPGTTSQSVSFVNLVDAVGNRLFAPDDTVFAGSGSQQLLVADTANNTIYAIQGAFQAGAAYASIGSTHSLDFVNLTTGVATSISDGIFASNAAPHGLAFIPAAAVPEPSSLVLSMIAVVAGLGYSWRRRTR
jgi:hypothetical protein